MTKEDGSDRPTNWQQTAKKIVKTDQDTARNHRNSSQDWSSAGVTLPV